MILSSHVAASPQEAYTLRNWADDLYEGGWESALKHRAASQGDRILQNLHVGLLTSAITKKSNLVKVSTGKLTADEAFLPSADHIAAFGLDRSGTVDRYLDRLRDLELEKGRGCVASELLSEFGKPGYGWQYRVNLRSIDESKTLFFGEAQRLIRLLKSSIPASSGETRTHYQALLHQLESALDPKD